MKRTILAVLMVLVIATPCFAQEVETDGIFSLHGTQWEVTKVRTKGGVIGPEDYILSFHHGQIYFCNSEGEECTLRNYRKPYFYFDLIGISYFQSGHHEPNIFGFCNNYTVYKGLASSLLGTGIMYCKMQLYLPSPRNICSERSYVATLTKINDNWIPPSE